MTPRDVIAESIYSNNVGGTSDPKLLELAEGFSIAAANDVLAALSAAGFVIVPREPTAAMLVDAGTMNGYDTDRRTADADHIAWWDAMLAAAEETPAEKVSG